MVMQGSEPQRIKEALWETVIKLYQRHGHNRFFTFKCIDMFLWKEVTISLTCKYELGSLKKVLIQIFIMWCQNVFIWFHLVFFFFVWLVGFILILYFVIF